MRRGEQEQREEEDEEQRDDDEVQSTSAPRAKLTQVAAMNQRAAARATSMATGWTSVWAARGLGSGGVSVTCCGSFGACDIEAALRARNMV